MNLSKWPAGFLVAFVFVLMFLLLRERAQLNVARNKFLETQSRVEKLILEKDAAISQAESDRKAFQAKLAQSDFEKGGLSWEKEQLILEKDSEIQNLKNQAQEARLRFKNELGQKTQKIQDLEGQSQEEKTKLETELKNKDEETQRLDARRQELGTNLDRTLAEKESLKKENTLLACLLEDARREIRRLRKDLNTPQSDSKT